MHQSLIQTLKIEAVNAVFSWLGDEMSGLLKYRLGRDYKLGLESGSSFTLQELYIALRSVLGDNCAVMLEREIHNEYEHLMLEQFR